MDASGDEFYTAMTAVEYKVQPVNSKAKAVLVALT